MTISYHFHFFFPSGNQRDHWTARAHQWIVDISISSPSLKWKPWITNHLSLCPAIETCGYSTSMDDYLGILQHYDPAAKLRTSQLRIRAALTDGWIENVTAARSLGMRGIRLATFRVAL
jgi:hypothetical protein